MNSERARVSSTPSLISTLVKSAQQVVLELGEVTGRMETSAGEWLVLDALTRNGPLSMAEISQHALSTGATLTRVVDALVSRALVYREVGPTDRRRVEVHLSNAGNALHARLLPSVEHLETEIRNTTATTSSLLQSLQQISAARAVALGQDADILG